MEQKNVFGYVMHLYLYRGVFLFLKRFYKIFRRKVQMANVKRCQNNIMNEILKKILTYFL